jgi:5-methylcytosine-specific restriction enzyme subunit McrC
MVPPVSAEQSRSIPIRNAWHMLLYAWDLAQWKGKWAMQVEAAPNLLGLLAKILLENVQLLLRRQLGREFLSTQQEIRGLRGKVCLGESIKRMRLEQGRTICRFSELSMDTLRNRIIFFTLDRLLREKQLAQGASPENAAHLRHELRTMVRQMEGVELRPIQSSDFSRIQLSRNDEPYRLPLAICALVNRLEMPTESQGDVALVELLRDKIGFAGLFERFVRNFYRYRLTDCQVVRERLKWPDELGSSFVPTMETDISLVSQEANGPRAVIDTKYYSDHLGSHHEGAEKFLSQHLYQMYAYLRTQDEQSYAHRCASGVLLYPAVKGDFDKAMKVQGHTIRVRTVRLDLEWDKIEADLLAIAAQALGREEVAA